LYKYIVKCNKKNEHQREKYNKMTGCRLAWEGIIGEVLMYLKGTENQILKYRECAYPAVTVLHFTLLYSVKYVYFKQITQYTHSRYFEI